MAAQSTYSNPQALVGSGAPAPPAGYAYAYAYSQQQPTAYAPYQPIPTPTQTAPQPAPQPPTYPQAPATKKRKIANPKKKLTHKCPWPGCDRWLSCPHNVQQHIREAHTHEKPYKCDQAGCNAEFTRPYCLYRHLGSTHGIKDAAPGRGRGEGLRRMGIKKKMKSKAEMGGVKVEGGEGGIYSGSADEMQGGQGMVAGGPKIFEINNFAPIPVSCVGCGADFGNREAFLAHQHDHHGVPSSADCNCMLCLDTFNGNNTVAAGVHVQENGAKMRNLMADDLFDFGSSTNEGEQMEQMPTVTGQQAYAAAAAQGDYKKMLAAMGMTEEEYTKNMHKPKPKPKQKPMTQAQAQAQLLWEQQLAVTPAVVDPEREARFAASMPKTFHTGKQQSAFRPFAIDPEEETRFVANMPKQYAEQKHATVGAEQDLAMDEMVAMDGEDLSAWLKSAEEIFGDVEME